MKFKKKKGKNNRERDGERHCTLEEAKKRIGRLHASADGDGWR